MSRWTTEESSLLSMLFGMVVGSPEMIAIRQDYCKLFDCVESEEDLKIYFTGSKAEGLNLPGSDLDYMRDINIRDNIIVVQNLYEVDQTNDYNSFNMCTRNVPPGFALLQNVKINPNFMFRPVFKNIHGINYLSSDMYVQFALFIANMYRSPGETYNRQGPSIEVWSPYHETSIDNVFSIHCTFWPTCASEWTTRRRCFAWPYSNDISSIIDFGCHLVPVGHPHSDTKLTEWRISFSMAERTLVWSFNHIQLQCYAVMKIILKEFIKIKCTEKNFVLCSYFIKTFLFWKFESTDLRFWCSENFRNCIKFLLIEFSKCIREGRLRHYFIPVFNLLSVKLTREAQNELLTILDLAVEYDINIFRECKTLLDIWSIFLSAIENRRRAIISMKLANTLNNDACLNCVLEDLFIQSRNAVNANLTKILSTVCKTPLKYHFIKKLLHFRHLKSLSSSSIANREVYQLHKLSNNDIFSVDVSTCELWYACVQLMKRDFKSTLSTVNHILSNIEPFTMYFCCHNSNHWGTFESKKLYVEMFTGKEITVADRVKTTCLLPLLVHKDLVHVMPLAIQIEAYFFLHGVKVFMPLSPFVCAYYLMFFSHHELHQYDERDRALRQLVDVANNELQSGPANYLSENITGHCLLIAGNKDQAYDFFIRSYESTKRRPPSDKHNSAFHYLNFFFNH